MINRISIQQLQRVIEEEISNLGEHLFKEDYPNRSWNRLLLNEEQGIAEAVKQITPQIYNELSGAITAEFPNAELATEMGEERDHIVRVCKCTPHIVLFGIETPITVYCTIFQNKSDFDDAYQKQGEGLFDACSRRKDNPYNKKIYQDITLRFIAINGQILKKQAVNSIQHEISHIYEQYKMRSPYPQDHGYGNAKDYLSSVDDLTKSLANILYFNGNGEINGFENGLYAELKTMMEYGYPLTRKLLYSSTTYDNIRTLEDSVKIIEDAQNDPIKIQEINSILLKWHARRTYRSIVYLGYKLISLYKRAIGRVWSQICKDCQTEF